MTGRQDILDAIRRNRADDTLRLAFADYLDGDADPREPERAEFIRAAIGVPHCEFVTLTGSDPFVKLGIIGDKYKGWGDGEDGLRIVGESGRRYQSDRGFLSRLRCPWEWWSANAAAILPEHPGLERVTLTTSPKITWDSGPGRVDYWLVDLPHRKVRQRAPILTTGDALKKILQDEWGGDPADGGWGVTFDLPGPDAHGDHYRHWEPGFQSRHLPKFGEAQNRIRQMAEQFAREDAADTERILRQLLAEHGITEDDLRAGRRQGTRLQGTDGPPPQQFVCGCETDIPIGAIAEEPDELVRFNILQLRERTFRRDRRRYRVGDAVCPKCQRFYFAVTRIGT